MANGHLMRVRRLLEAEIADAPRMYNHASAAASLEAFRELLKGVGLWPLTEGEATDAERRRTAGKDGTCR